MLEIKEAFSLKYHKKKVFDHNFSHKLKLFSSHNNLETLSKRDCLKEYKSEKNKNRACLCRSSSRVMRLRRENPRNSNKRIGCPFCYPRLNTMLHKRKEKLGIINNTIKYFFICS